MIHKRLKDVNILNNTNVIILLCDQSLFLIKKMEPMIEGIAKLINHKNVVDKMIPKILSENIPIKKMAREPRIPNSIRVVVGTKVANKYIRLIEI